MQAMKASSDENRLTPTPTLRIGLKRHLFDFCFFCFLKKKRYMFFVSPFLVLYKKSSFVKKIDLYKKIINETNMKVKEVKQMWKLKQEEQKQTLNTT
jgi:hypothetical protein